jgi:hypothetical protein
MQHYLLIQLLFVFLNIVEALHDSVVIKLQDTTNPRFENLRKLWHEYSGLYYIGVIALAMFVAHVTVVWLALLILLNRVWVFEVLLNVKLYGWKKWYYMEDRGINGWIRSKLPAFVDHYYGQFKIGISLLITILINLFVI